MCPAVIGVAQSELLNRMSKNWDVLARREYTDYNPSYRYIFIVQGLPNFPTLDLVTPNNTLSITHSPRLLASEYIRNAENIESLLVITYSGVMV